MSFKDIIEKMEQADREREERKALNSLRVEMILFEQGATVHGFEGGTYTIPED